MDDFGTLRQRRKKQYLDPEKGKMTKTNKTAQKVHCAWMPPGEAQEIVEVPS